MKSTRWASPFYLGQQRRINDRPINEFSRCIAAITAVLVLSFMLPVLALADEPYIVGSCDTPGYALGIAQGGTYSYVADDGGLQIIDVSNPQAPYIEGYCSTPGAARDVALTGNYIYMADHTAGLQVIDVSNPDTPAIVGSSPGFAFGVAHAGSYAYVANHDDGLQVINVSTPTAPVIAGTCDTQGTAYQIAVAGNYAYVTEWTAGLEVIDISNPTGPVPVGLCDTPGGAWGIFLTGNYAFVADSDYGLQVIDISEPTTPVIVGTCDTPYSTSGVAVAGSYAYITEPDYGIEVIDISNPAAPVIVASCVTTDTAFGVALSGSHAYVTQGFSGLDVIAALSTTPGYTVLGYFHEVQYGPGGLAYDESTNTLWSSDIIAKTILKIDPNNGSVLTTLYVSYNALPTGLTYKDGYLWNSDQWAVPEIIHKVNPANGNSVDTIPGLGGLTFDNQGRLWSNNWDIELRALDPNNGSILDTIVLPDFDPTYDQTLGLAFDENTGTLWVSVVEHRWGGGTPKNWLLNVGLDGTVLSKEEFDPNPALDGYELFGLAFDNNTNTLWANYSQFDKPPTTDDTYIYHLSVGVPSGDPVIDKLRRKRREPGQKFNIVGSNFGWGNLGDYVRIGPKELPYDHNRIIEWTPTNIKVKIPKTKYVKNGCAWFKGLDERKVKVWVNVGGVESNKKRLTLIKNPADCQ